jgi:ABC transporter with metal-binding/Fe-S-binding domain ATP-binding protein
MGYAALTSGGKDSILACQKALDQGIAVDTLVTVRPENRDSYMFHSANLDAVRVIAEVAGMEYEEIKTHGRKEDELVDLEKGVARLGCEGLVTGAVGSVYQRDRIARLAEKHSLDLFAPLWHMDPEVLLREVAERMDAILIVTAADGLDETFLGAHIDDALIARLKKVAAKHHIHLAGEGGEYETLALNAPFYRRRIRFASSDIVSVGNRHELVLGGFSS